MPASIIAFPALRAAAPDLALPPHRESLTRTFDETGRFQALEAARAWLAARAFSCGVMEGPNAIGIRLGQHRIPKWTHMGPRDRLTLHGRITGDMAQGLVTVEIFASAPEAAKSAFSHQEA